MQPSYYVKHADGSYSLAEPQPAIDFKADLQDKPAVAIELAPDLANAVCDSVVVVCVRPQ